MRWSKENLINGLAVNFVGFRQTRDFNYAPINNDFINNVDNFNSIAPNVINSKALETAFQETDTSMLEDWTAVDSYLVGELVLDNGNVYKCIQDNTGEPTTDELYWEFISSIPTIQNFYEDIITESKRCAIVDIFRDRTNKDVNMFYGNLPTYEASGIKESDGSFRLKPNDNKFVCFKFEMLKQTERQIQLNKVGLHFDGAVTLPIYVYHESNNDAIYQFDIEYTAPLSVQWFDLENILLSLQADDHAVGGNWYIGYYQQDLGDVKAVEHDYTQFIGAWCGSCNHGRKSREYQSIYQKYYVGYPYSFTEGQSDYTTKKVVSGLGGYEDNGIGLNFQMSVFNDPTYTLLMNSEILKEAIKLKGAILCLEHIMHSKTLNFNTERNQSDAQILSLVYGTEVNGEDGQKSIYEMYKEAISDVQLHLDRLSGFGSSKSLLRYDI